MKITIVYDNKARQPTLKTGWGFSCIVETQDTPQILFDTGADGSVLLHNMRQLKFDPSAIGIVVISHSHWDHTGGLQDIMEANKAAELYIPESFGEVASTRKITRVKEGCQICKNIFTTGELQGIEQSLAINTDKGIVVIVGCSHPGVENILNAASRFGKIYGIVGGFHGFHNLDRLSPLSLICPCHCTQYKIEIKYLFQDRCLDCGAGVVIELGDA